MMTICSGPSTFVATIVDPRFKHTTFGNCCTRLKLTIQPGEDDSSDIVGRVITFFTDSYSPPPNETVAVASIAEPNSSGHNPVSFIFKKRKTEATPREESLDTEFERYLLVPTIEEAPLAWWQAHAKGYPRWRGWRQIFWLARGPKPRLSVRLQALAD